MPFLRRLKLTNTDKSKKSNNSASSVASADPGRGTCPSAEVYPDKLGHPHNNNIPSTSSPDAAATSSPVFRRQQAQHPVDPLPGAPPFPPTVVDHRAPPASHPPLSPASVDDRPAVPISRRGGRNITPSVSTDSGCSEMQTSSSEPSDAHHRRPAHLGAVGSTFSSLQVRTIIRPSPKETPPGNPVEFGPGTSCKKGVHAVVSMYRIVQCKSLY